MLTPQEITGQDFVRAVFGGYDMSAVDEFLEKVNTDYAALYKENAILKSKIKVLVEKVEEYRSTEDAMRMALLTAQKMGDEMVNEANKKRDELMEKAEADSKARVEELRRELADEEARLSAAKEATRNYVESARELVRNHDQFLSRLDEITAPEPVEPEPDPEWKREEEIVDTARAIDSAVTRLVEEETAPYVPAAAESPAAAPAAEEPPVEEPVFDTAVFDEIRAEAPKFDEPAFTEPKPEVPKFDEPAFIEPKPEALKFDEPAVAAPIQSDTHTFRMKTPDVDWSDEDEPTSPRPKFNFDNLKFGDNYSAEE